MIEDQQSCVSHSTFPRNLGSFARHLLSSQQNKCDYCIKPVSERSIHHFCSGLHIPHSNGHSSNVDNGSVISPKTGLRRSSLKGTQDSSRTSKQSDLRVSFKLEIQPGRNIFDYFGKESAYGRVSDAENTSILEAFIADTKKRSTRVCCFCFCFGILSLIYARKSMKAMEEGRVDEAEYYINMSRTLSVLTVVAGSVILATVFFTALVLFLLRQTKPF